MKATVSIDRDGESTTVRLRCGEVRSLADARTAGAKLVELTLDSSQVDPDRMGRLKQVLLESPGPCRTQLRVRIPEVAEVDIELPDSIKVSPNDALVDRVEALFGRGVVRFA